MDRSGIKGVIFDFDGVICQTEVYRMDYREAMMAKYGVQVDRRAYYGLIGTPPISDYDNEWGRRMDRIFGDQEAYRSHREELIAFPRLTYDYPALATPGIGETMGALRKAGLRIGVASNSRQEVLDRALEDCGLREYVTEVLSGWELGRPKPDPYIYQLAMDRLGLEPGECVIVEDSQHGIQAGKAAGAAMVFALHDRDGLLDQEGCDKVLWDIRELLGEIGVSQ